MVAMSLSLYLSSDLCTMSWFNDVGYQQYGIGSYLYTLLLKDKIQALAAGDIVAWEVAIIKAAISNLIKF